MTVTVISESDDSAIVVTTDGTTFGPTEQSDVEVLQDQIDDLVADLATTNSALATANENIATLTGGLATANSAITAANALISKLRNNQFARVCRNSNQTGLANGAFTRVDFDNVTFDPTNIWNNTTKQFKPTIAGYYRVTWTVTGVTGGGNSVAMSAAFKNGVRYGTGAASYFNLAAASISVGTEIMYFNGISDVVEVQLYIEGSASRDILGGSHLTNFEIELVKAD